MSKRNNDVDLIGLLMTDKRLKDAIENSASTKEILSAYNAGKNKQASETKSGCLTWIVIALLLAFFFGGQVSATEISKDNDEGKNIDLSSNETNLTSYASRLKSSGITVTEAQLLAAEILDNACEKSVGAERTLIVNTPRRVR